MAKTAKTAKVAKNGKPGAKRHRMVSGTLAPLYSFWVKVGLKRGSGPDRGRSPVEWGDFPSVRTYVRWVG